MKHNIESLLSLFTKIRRFYANELQNKLMEANLSPNEISILILLFNNPSISTSSQLVCFLNVSKGLVSRSVDDLIKKELIQCQIDQEDKRIQRLTLTKKALPLISKIEMETRKINERVLKDISEAEINQMENTIKKIIDRFDLEKGSV